MAIFKCKMCGGDLNVQEGVSVCECEYCGTKQTIPTADNEKKINAFNRANHLRSSCEFDKAAGVYESIVSEFPEEAEAYWGLCLCKFGIEYVDDPATGKKIPTCHRTSYESIFEDSNFEQALEWADSVAHSVYRAEAKEIDRLQKEILDIARNEEPFDVFICYKETDDLGQRTVDSELAHDIYDVLTEKGYKVFYARITLKAKLGQDYEPYIFSALNSAKVMLAIGTKYEYYNAVWVKNEWSRFLALMSSDNGKTLIPCYRDIDAYDMPKEFKHLQGQDLRSPRAFQDLVSNIEKIIPLKGNEEQTVQLQPASGVPTADSLTKRATMFLEDEEYEKADEYAEKALDANPENAYAYLVKLCVELHVSKMDDLGYLGKPFDQSKNYNKIIRFGDEKLKSQLIKYNSKARERVLANEKAKLNEPIIKSNINPFDVLTKDEAYTFDNYIVGPSNNLAFAAAKAVSEKMYERNNPLFIYGDSGLGKTHLLKAIKLEMQKNYPGINIFYIPAETFFNEFIHSIQTNTVEIFDEKYRNADALLVDDIQFIAGKDQTEDKFFHIFNELYNQNKVIVLTSDRPAKEIKSISDRLRTRFSSGLTADVKQPEYETRFAIIQSKANLLNFNISVDVIDYIANKLKSNVRQIQGVVIKLCALYQINDERPTIESASRVIKEMAEMFTFPH